MSLRILTSGAFKTLEFRQPRFPFPIGLGAFIFLPGLRPINHLIRAFGPRVFLISPLTKTFHPDQIYQNGNKNPNKYYLHDHLLITYILKKLKATLLIPTTPQNNIFPLNNQDRIAVPEHTILLSDGLLVSAKYTIFPAESTGQE
ncbi:MAG: hypothetical protein Greene041636_811 [Parcubacteria group bacterium Greene0416_36]|nr:MAG: hypothetical protein Greene041636_811 [Parcubacteria group bacterium Greene0416_36]